MINDQILKNLEQHLNNANLLSNHTLNTLLAIKDLILDFGTGQTRLQHPNPLNRFGRKCFSQTDEDGITLEILKRMGLTEGTFAEFGVGNGSENNTLVLAALGWKGFWVGGEDLFLSLNNSSRFAFIKSWITLDNILQHFDSGTKSLSSNTVDLISLDLDGNDIYFVEHLLANRITPKIFIVEYNALFPPPVKFQIAYDPNHKWNRDSYFGAALQNFVEVFDSHGYKLVCCNSHSGANAFFVQKEYEHLFLDVPEDIADIYVPPRYKLYSQYGHRNSPRVVANILSDEQM
jgi:hypothetical protein